MLPDSRTRRACQPYIGTMCSARAPLLQQTAQQVLCMHMHTYAYVDRESLLQQVAYGCVIVGQLHAALLRLCRIKPAAACLLRLLTCWRLSENIVFRMYQRDCCISTHAEAKRLLQCVKMQDGLLG